MIRFACWMLTAAGVLLLGPSLGISPPPGRAAGNPTWGQVDAGLSPDIDLNSVYLTNGPDSAWAGGNLGQGGVVRHLQRQGAGWAADRRQAFGAPVRAIAVLGDNDVWAVGDTGLIAHARGAAWAELPSPVAGANLTTIQMFGQGEEGYAAGWIPAPVGGPGFVQGVLLHYRQGQWQSEPDNVLPTYVQSLHFTVGGGWAVGQLYSAPVSGPPGAPQLSLLSHFDDRRWSVEATPICPTGFVCDSRLNAVRALSADEAWAAGTRMAGHGGGRPRRAPSPPCRGPVAAGASGDRYRRRSARRGAQRGLAERAEFHQRRLWPGCRGAAG